MNAVISKPRGKAKPKIAKNAVVIQQPKIGIADIRSWIKTADEKLEAVYDAAERGEPLDVLLDHLCHSVLCTPIAIIHREDLTRADAQRLYAALFPVLACIQAAIKLAEGTILQHGLEEAFALLDTAQTALDPVNDAVRALPEGGPEHDFNRGRDLAIEMLAKCRERSSDCECYRRNRDAGKPQHNIVMDYLTELACDSTLEAGFTAVLSGAIGPEILDADWFKNLTLADTKAGAPGEDGTQALADDTPVATSCAPVGDSFDHATFDDVYCTISEVIAIIEARAHDVDSSDLVFGALYTTERAYGILSTGIDTRDWRACEDASAPLAVALAVLSAALEKADDVALFGAERLLLLAKDRLDDACNPSGKGQQ
ncbi:hypothetical protein [Variovorax boronicumulans]|uniref:hypothetical protein n=1 Tax=Variovorax boronicumulans TaxID=436515 RepID=UPI00277F8526|nr:hypothetical protein [Variovorax boronicumulans]MDQ0040866.1 hypothetical protein [Variovorax boronicumulans]